MDQVRPAAANPADAKLDEAIGEYLRGRVPLDVAIGAVRERFGTNVPAGHGTTRSADPQVAERMRALEAAMRNLRPGPG